MTRQKKEEIVSRLTSEFENANSIIVCGYNGLTVSELESLRKSAKEQGVKVQVVKNSLASIALNNNDLSGLDLEGMNIFVWSDDAITASKVAVKFGESNKKFEVKSAFIDREVADVSRVEAFAKLPGREELLGMLASVWMGPIRNWTIGLNALKEKKENQ